MSNRKYEHLTEQWVDLYLKAGFSTQDIADDYEVASRTVGKYLREGGVEIPQSRYRHLVDHWVHLYTQEDCTLQEIADRYSASTNIISRELKKKDVEVSHDQRQFSHLADKWARLYEEKRLTTYEIAEQADVQVCPTTVGNYIEDKVSMRRIEDYDHKEFEHLIDEWIQLYEKEGLLVKEIAEKYEAAAPTICHYLNDAGVDTGIKKEYPVEKWIEHYKKEGLSTRQIAEKYDCGKDTVIARLREKDVEVTPHGENRLTRDLVLEKVDRSGECWLWKPCRTQHGYGSISLKGEKHLAHRLSYRLWKGEITEGQVVRHRCDNPQCVRPEHLETGSQKENGEDHRLWREQLFDMPKAQMKRIIDSNQPWHVLADKYGVRIAVIRALNHEPE